VDINIERAEISEAEILVTIYRDAYSENENLGFPASASRVSINEVEEWIKSTILLTAKELVTNSIIGTVRLKYSEDWKCYVLGRLAIKSIYKGRGIAAKLMEYTENELLIMDEQVVRLTVAKNHPYLTKMYQNKGYKIIGDRLLNDLPYDEIIMEKSL